MQCVRNVLVSIKQIHQNKNKKQKARSFSIWMKKREQKYAITFDLVNDEKMPGINYRYLLLIYIQVLVRRRKRIKENDGPKQRRLPKFWVRPSLQKREELGIFHTLFQEYREDDREYFFRFPQDQIMLFTIFFYHFS